MSDEFNVVVTARDYECDMQGIINNAVYLNYFEHARHCFLAERHTSFTDLIAQDIYLVLFKCELQYYLPIYAGDELKITVNLEKPSKLKLKFNQKIYVRGKLTTEATSWTACRTPAGKPLPIDGRLFKV